MIRKINFKNTGTPSEAKDSLPANTARDTGRHYTTTVEYSIVAGLVLQQYQVEGEVQWDKLLALPFEDRIPGLIMQYGKKTVHRLLQMALSEFIATLELAAYRRPTQTRVRVAVCDIMLTAHEDYLSIEDVILFLQRVRAGYYGTIKTLVNMQPLLDFFDQYRQERHTAYMNLKEQQERSYKQIGPVERTAPQPTLLGDLFSQALIVDMNKKMSG